MDQGIDEATRYFEDKIKKCFNPYEVDNADEDYYVPIKGAPEIPEIGLESSLLEFQRCYHVWPSLLMIGRSAWKFSSLYFLKFVALLRHKLKMSQERRASPLR